MTTNKYDIWYQGKSTSVRLPAPVWKGFLAKCEELTLTKTDGARLAQREHNGSLAEAITAWVGSVPLHDACSLWLASVIEAMRPAFTEAGYPLPDNITAKIALPATGWKGKAIGDYWGPHCHVGFDAETHTIGTGLHTIFIHPCETNPAKIVSTLVHELCHAADNRRNDWERAHKEQLYAPVKSPHGHHFKAIGEAMGLDGKPKCMSFPDLASLPAYAQAALEAAGKIPHNPLNWAVKKEKTDTNRHLKFEHEDCEQAVEGKAPVWRMAKTTAGHLAQVACPCCGERIPNPYFEGGDEDELDGIEGEEEAQARYDRHDYPERRGTAPRKRTRATTPHAMEDRCAFAEDKPLKPRHDRIRHSLDISASHSDVASKLNTPAPDSIRKRGRKGGVK